MNISSNVNVLFKVLIFEVRARKISISNLCVNSKLKYKKKKSDRKFLNKKPQN